MLIAKIFANDNFIDEIHIKNVGKAARSWPRDDAYNYEIRKPAGVKTVITHNRSDGYGLLLSAALLEIEKIKGEGYEVL